MKYTTCPHDGTIMSRLQDANLVDPNAPIFVLICPSCHKLEYFIKPEYWERIMQAQRR